ncbi:MAG TPA: dihydroxyacetone kinase phosphoryl donor subunit DhaM [Ktedonobacterales bacterium]|nr:dihydroxyacetone kinase phosphoryl donor subunit DhaM [Ktedonobacterales bacterium]
MAVGLVIVSHSQRLAEGVAELAGEMTHGAVKIIPAGGADDGGLGESFTRVRQALDAAASPEGVLILVDLGGAALTASMAIEDLPEERRALVRLSGAPLVEGAVIAAVESSIGSDLERVATAASEAMSMDKGVAGQAGG